MRELESKEEIVRLCKALSSDIRLEIVNLLGKHESLNLNELARLLGVTNGAMTAHIKLLAEAGIIKVRHSSGKRGSQKTCSLRDPRYLLKLLPEDDMLDTYEAEIPIGQYSNYAVFPTCGIATPSSIIGEIDDNRYFDSPQRTEAGILWFTHGFLEYRIPNYLRQGQTPSELQFSFEISSEAPGTCEHWLSDISFSLNDQKLGEWTSPGDFGDTKGLYAPDWWPHGLNQYGLLKLLSINREGCFIDGRKISDVTIDQLELDYKSELRLRFAVEETADHLGGMTLFGRHFGNYNQDILVRVRYHNT